jgi:hypothetical protein
VATHRIYLRKEQELEMQKQAHRLGLEVDDLIKTRLALNSHDEQQPDLLMLLQQMQSLREQVSRMEQMQRCWYQLYQNLWIDIAFTRGALEAQATTEVKERGEELEGRRLRQFQKMQEELVYW